MENESTSFRSSSRLREKERISYSEEEHIQFIEYLDPNNYPDEGNFLKNLLNNNYFFD